MEASNAFTKRRVENEKKEILSNPPMNWKIIYSNEKWNEWDVWITAEPNCPFHSTPFKLTVQFSDNYPNQKPLLKLENFQRFYHPNISAKDGTICEQTIKSTKITTTIRQRINAFVVLLAIPNPDSALNVPAALQYKSDYRKYFRKTFQQFKGYKK